MKNKQKNGMAIALVVVLVFVFVLVGTAVFMASYANVQNSNIIYRMDLEFFEAEGYLHQSIVAFRDEMEIQLYDRIYEFVENIPIIPGVIIPPEGGTVGLVLAEYIAEYMDDNDFIASVVGYIENSFALAYTAFRNDPTHPNVELESLELISVDIPPPNITAGISSADVLIQPIFTLQSQSYGGTIAAVDVVLGITFQLNAPGELYGYTLLEPDADTIHTKTADGREHNHEDCNRDCFYGIVVDGVARYYTCIRNEAELRAMTLTGHYILVQDIDFYGLPYFVPIGMGSLGSISGNDGGSVADAIAVSFRGIFNGNGNTIHNMHVGTGQAQTRQQSFGMFRLLGDGAIVENLILNGSVVTGGTHTGIGSDTFNNNRGALAGSIMGSGETIIRNILVNDVYVTGQRYLGGLVGSIRGGASADISYIHVTGNIGNLELTSDSHAGGLVGRIGRNLYGVPADPSSLPPTTDTAGEAGIVNIRNIVIDANVSTRRWYSGGIVGGPVRGSVTIQNAFVQGTVRGSTRVGGAVGSTNGIINAQGVRLYDIVSTANVYGDSPYAMGIGYVGGLVGWHGWHSTSNVIGRPHIRRSASYGNVYASGRGTVGGLVGRMAYGAAIWDSYSVGNVYGTDRVGGLVGQLYSDGTIVERSYSAGLVAGGQSVFGTVSAGTARFIGHRSGSVGTLANNFVDSTTNFTPTVNMNGSTAGIDNISQAVQALTTDLNAAYLPTAEPNDMTNPSTFTNWTFGTLPGNWHPPSSDNPINPRPHHLPWRISETVGNRMQEPTLLTVSFVRLENLREATPN